VAITDTERILGFSGVGSDHHAPGGPVLTRATHDVLDSGQPAVLWSRADIGCEVSGCPLAAAIVVPLMVRGAAEGTLKAYYSSSRLLTEPHVDMIASMGQLLSTQLELSELERQSELATRMELQALQAQINPHFLFNTINTIASLIRTDPPEARRLLREFAAFYRRTLEHGEDLIQLEQELEYTRSYLTLEHARFGDRIVVEERVTAEALELEVPAFIIQPLVENAIQHGMRPEGDLHVAIEADVTDGCLRIRVRDDGRGIAADDLPRVFEPGFGRGLGVALRNVNERLRGHFGPESRLLIESEEDQGTVASMLIALDRTRKGVCAE